MKSLLESLDDFVDFVKEKKAKGVLKDTLVLSVFEAEEKDKELLTRLQNAVPPPPPSSSSSSVPHPFARVLLCRVCGGATLTRGGART